MPVVYEEGNEDTTQQPGQPVTQQQSQVIGGSTGGQQDITPNKPTRSGSFTNLRAYIDANRGQGEQMAQKVSSGITKQQDTARTGLQGAQQSFQQQVGSAGNVYGQAEKDLIGQVATNPEGVDAGWFTKLRTGNYTGPQNLSDVEGYAPVQQQFNNLGQYQQALGTESGKQALLQEAYQRPDYGRGQQSLDTLLVQTDPNAQNRLLDLRAQLGTNPGVMEGAKASAAALASEKAKQTADAKSAAYNALGMTPEGEYLETGAIPTLQQGIQSKMTSLPIEKQTQLANYMASIDPQKQAQLAAINKAKEDFAAQLGNEWISKLGPTPLGTLNPIQGAINARQAQMDKARNLVYSAFGNNASAIPGIDQYVDYQLPTLTQSSVATPEEYAKAQALAKLAGVENTFIPNQQEVGSYANVNPLLREDEYKQAVSNYISNILGGIDTTFRF